MSECSGYIPIMYSDIPQSFLGKGCPSGQSLRIPWLYYLKQFFDKN